MRAVSCKWLQGIYDCPWKKIICCMSYLQIWKSMLADAQGKLYECEGQRKAKCKSPRQEDALPTVKANILSPEDMIKERCLPKFRNLCTENRYDTFMAKRTVLMVVFEICLGRQRQQIHNVKRTTRWYSLDCNCESSQWLYQSWFLWGDPSKWVDWKVQTSCARHWHWIIN